MSAGSAKRRQDAFVDPLTDRGWVDLNEPADVMRGEQLIHGKTPHASMKESNEIRKTGNESTGAVLTPLRKNSLNT
jgi:hypothetical protein